MSCNTFDSIGSKFSPRIMTPEQALQRVMSVDKRIAYDNNSLQRHDPILMAAALNNVVRTVPSTYTIIIDRQTVQPLLPSDFASFVEWAGYTDSDAYEISMMSPSSDPLTTMYELLEYYLDPNFAKSATGNSCAGLVNKLAQIVGFLSAGAKLINELMNFSLASVIAQLNAWKEMLQQMVDELKDRILAKLNNFVNQIKAYAFQLQAAFGRFMKRVERVKQFLSDLSIQSIKDKIEEIIAKIAGQFEELTPEVMLHILMIICQLADSITSFLQSPLDALKNMFNNFTAAEFNLTQMTNERVAASVEVGLPRMQPETPRRVVEEAAAGNGKLRDPVMSDDERTFISQLKNSTNGSVTVGSVTITHAAQPIADEQAVPKAGGWTYVIDHHPMIYVIVYRIAKTLGKPISINCAYRSPAKNEALRAADPQGVAKNSLHMQGMALDVSTANLSTEERAFFVKLASREGCGGIQHYPASNTKFIHIDLGTVRSWSPSGKASMPQVIKDAIANHERGYSPQFTPEEQSRLPTNGPSMQPTSGIQ